MKRTYNQIGPATSSALGPRKRVNKSGPYDTFRKALHQINDGNYTLFQSLVKQKNITNLDSQMIVEFYRLFPEINFVKLIEALNGTDVTSLELGARKKSNSLVDPITKKIAYDMLKACADTAISKLYLNTRLIKADPLVDDFGSLLSKTSITALFVSDLSCINRQAINYQDLEVILNMIKDSHLSSVSLYNLVRDDRSLDLLGNYIRENRNLKSLSIDGDFLYPHILKFSKFLSLSNIKILSFSSVGLKNKAVESLIKSFTKIKGEILFLKGLFYNSALCFVSEHLSRMNLKSLSLEGSFTDHGVRHLSKKLNESNLIHFSLRANGDIYSKFTNVGAAKLLSVLAKTRIQRLNLSSRLINKTIHDKFKMFFKTALLVRLLTNADSLLSKIEALDFAIDEVVIKYLGKDLDRKSYSQSKSLMELKEYLQVMGYMCYFAPELKEHILYYTSHFCLDSEKGARAQYQMMLNDILGAPDLKDMDRGLTPIEIIEYFVGPIRIKERKRMLPAIQFGEDFASISCTEDINMAVAPIVYSFEASASARSDQTMSNAELEEITSEIPDQELEDLMDSIMGSDSSPSTSRFI